MKVKDIVNADIVRLGDNGEGICKVDNLVVFVPFAPLNSNCKIRIDKINKKYANATVLQVNSAETEVLTPRCEHFTKCGGCDLQYLNYQSELDFKREKVANLLYKISGKKVNVLPVIAGQEWEYRNKIQLQVGLSDNTVVVGFFNKQTHNIVPIKKCYLYEDWANKLIDIFTTWANANRITAYNEKSNKGLLKNVVARNIGGKIVVTVVINGDKVNKIELLLSALQEEFDCVSLYVSINKRKNSEILGDKLIKIYDDGKLICVDNLMLELSPYSFFQVNNEVRNKLYQEVVKSTNNSEIIIDAYSGIGVLSTKLAKSASHVFGIEIVKEAVENADKICQENGFCGQITNILGDSAIILPKLVSLLKEGNINNFTEFIRKNTIAYNDVEYGNLFNKQVTVVLDPPRKGCDLSVLKAVLDVKAKKVCYVSCNPATLARDLQILQQGYTIKKVQPFDMFPKTAHIETLVVLNRK